MSYVNPNYPTKKAFREAVAAGARLETYSPGPFGVKRDGEDVVEGPHYPQPHRWYARVKVEGGIVVKVLS